MGYRKYLLILFLLFCFKAKAQENSYQQADSISYGQYLAGNWQQLLEFGKQTIQSGTDFPLLRLRMAYASFITQNYTAALEQYNQVLANDSFNQIARYYAYWCNIYLNRRSEANYHASFIDKKTLNDERLSSVLTHIGLEITYKIPDDQFRSNANFTRIFAGNRIGWRLQADQSLAYYNQQNNPEKFPPPNLTNNFDRNQFEYYGKLSYTLNSKLILLGAYHLVSTNQLDHIGLLGLKLAQKNTVLQADVNYSKVNNLSVFQYNANLSWYPLGNLNLYTLTRGVLQQNKTVNSFNLWQLIGGKIAKNVWTEASATFGKQNNYLEYDALYVYNSVDVTTFKTQLTAYFQLNPHLLLPLTYMFERKNNAFQNLNYNQHSITAAILWRF